ncbi:phosphotransferase family protein [Natronosalvus halobius]|uniref:phosphotransferase family protein n=1 Tax=Natronosalvus halobius TaxID=2953746 RepID=UPI00209E68A9|nr:phosphotransferase [Natronosalvus halobius]USZ71697.1 phosphotransferase [Natronosalvus halobius]
MELPQHGRDLLESTATDYQVLDEIHAVAPHVVYEVSVDGRRAVVKVDRGPRANAAVEGRVLRYVSRETDVPVPKVIAVGAGGFVAAYRDDAPEDPPATRRLEREWLRVAGRSLARLHEEATFDRPGLLTTDGDPADPNVGLEVDSPADATWSDALDDLLGVYEDALSNTEYVGVVADARAFLARHASRFDDADRRQSSLLHGWFTPEHVSVRGADPSCVIDFEHALVGDGEWDYWRAAIPLFHGPQWKGAEDAEAVFRDGYESVRPLSNGFEARAPAYCAFVAASHLDSLSTQRGIDEGTREMATFLETEITETLSELERRFA